MPQKYTIDGQKISPPLSWFGVPSNANSLALIMLDLDVPPSYGGFFLHWAVYNIPANIFEFKEGSLPKGAKWIPNTYATYGNRSLGCYGPPWPVDKAHRYEFTLYALNKQDLGLPKDAVYDQLKAAIRASTIGTAKLIGVFGPAKTPLPKN
jgi:Raf kinase inhibitor-like YbhB/YbcL family protein